MKFNLQVAKEIYKNAINFLELNWPNYKPSPACLYESKGVGYLLTETDDLIINSSEYNLYGSTTMIINGVRTAIVDVECFNGDDKLTAVMIHELFHVHQTNTWTEITGPDPQYLITYPIDYKNECLRKLENESLVQGHLNHENKLEEFLTYRLSREVLIDDSFVSYEESIETFEGCAYFLEHEYLRQRKEKRTFDSEVFNQINLNQLSSEKLRVQYLAKGGLLADALNSYIPNWKHIIENKNISLMEILLFTYPLSKRKNIQVEDIVIEHMITDIKINQSRIEKKIEEDVNMVTLRFISSPEIFRVDPMNMLALSKNRIFHKNTISIGKGEYILDVEGINLISEYKDSMWEIENIVLPLAIESVKTGQLFECKEQNIKMKWFVEDVIEGKNDKKILLLS